MPTPKQTIQDAYIYEDRAARLKIEAEGIIQHNSLRKLIVPFRPDPNEGVAFTCGTE